MTPNRLFVRDLCLVAAGIAAIATLALALSSRDIVASTVAMNEAYIRESIARPREKARPGSPPTVPSFEGLLSDRDVTALVAYIASLE